MKGTIYQEEVYDSYHALVETRFWLKLEDGKGTVIQLQQLDEDENGYAYSLPALALKLVEVFIQ